MQTDYKQIYKMAADKHGMPEQLYKDLGNFVFAELYAKLRKPPTLIMKLRGIGQWHLRRKRMKAILEIFPLDHERYEKEEFSKYTLFKYENKKEIHEIFKKRLEDYDRYIELRDEIRKKRHETQTVIPPVDRSDERHKSS